MTDIRAEVTNIMREGGQKKGTCIYMYVHVQSYYIHVVPINKPATISHTLSTLYSLVIEGSSP